MYRIKKFFNKTNNVKSASIILIITLTLSNFLGLIRDHYLAQKISTGELDIYYAAFRFPDFIFNILILGAISAAFIPIFTSYLNKNSNNHREAWDIANSFLNISFVILVIFALLLFILMPFLIPILVPNFDTLKQIETIRLARLMLFSPIFFGLSYVFGGILNSFKRFMAYSIAPLVYNFSIIISTLLFADKYGFWAPAYGVIIGAMLHLLIQVPTAIHLGWKPKSIFDYSNPGLRKIIRLMIPRSIGLGVNQIMLLVYTSIASMVGVGSVAIWNLADNIQTMPTVVFGTSLATAVFPTLSGAISLGNHEDFTRYFWRGFRAITLVLIPAAIGIILLRVQIVRLILGSGDFGWDETVQTASTLGFFAIGIVAQGIIPLMSRSFYSLHNTKTPTLIGVFSMIASIILGYLLAINMKVSGLALAFSISGFINAILLYIYLRKELPILRTHEKEIKNFIIKVIFSTIIMSIIVQLSKYVLGNIVDMQRVWGVFVQCVGSIIFGVITYLYMAKKYKFEEFSLVFETIKNKFLR